MAARLRRTESHDEAQTASHRTQVRRPNRSALHDKGKAMKLATLKNGAGAVVIDDHVVALADLDGVPRDVTAVLAAGPQVASDVSLKAADIAQRRPLVEA